MQLCLPSSSSPQTNNLSFWTESHIDQSFIKPSLYDNAIHGPEDQIVFSDLHEEQLACGSVGARMDCETVTVHLAGW